MTTNTTSPPPAVVDRATWQAQLDDLRAQEKAHAREGDAIAAARRRLPMVEMDPAITLLHSRDVTYATFCQGPYDESPVRPRATTPRSETMTDHKTATREEWLAARRQLLEAEKELTRRSDELAQRRQELPWVRIDKEYFFDTAEGGASLADLFCGRSQLLIYHFMFGPDYTAGCPSCSSIADGFNGLDVHLANHDVTLCAVSRAPLAKLHAYKRRMGWSFPWASSHGGDFNTDFNVWFTEEQQREGGIEYNYQREPVFEWRAGQEGGGEGAEDQFAAMCGTDTATYHRDRPGMSAFALEGGVIYHTYSTYARGLDALWGMYQWLDRAPRGRNETGVWWRRHDEYDSQ